MITSWSKVSLPRRPGRQLHLHQSLAERTAKKWEVSVEFWDDPHFVYIFLGDLFDFKWDWIGYITNDMWFCVWKLGILIWIGYLKVENIMINPYESMDLGVAYFQTIPYLCWLILGMKPRISIDKQRIDLWTTMILYLLKPQLLGGFFNMFNKNTNSRFVLPCWLI